MVSVMEAPQSESRATWDIYAQETEWFMARRDIVYVVYINGVMSDASFGRYIAKLEADLCDPSRERAAVLYDVRTREAFSASRGKAIADLLRQYQVTTNASTLAYAFASPSLAVRGALRAVFWLTPPKYPCAVVDEADEGFAFLALHAPSLDEAELAASYRALVGDFERDHPPLMAGL